MLKKFEEKKSEFFEKAKLIDENDAKIAEIKRKRDFETGEDEGKKKKRKVSESGSSSEESSDEESEE